MDTTKMIIEFGVSELHYSIYNEETQTFSTPRTLAAAANLSLSPSYNTLKFKGLDGIEREVETIFCGYDGTISIYNPSIHFLKDVFDYEVSENGLITEKKQVTNKTISLLYTSNNIRNAFLNVKIKRPDLNLETISKQTNISKLNLKVTIRDLNEKLKIYCDKSSVCYNNWFDGSVLNG